MGSNLPCKHLYIKENDMEVGSAIALAAPIGVGLAALGSGIGLGLAVASGLEAIGRQPEASGKIMTSMIIGAALIEALTIYALIVFFTLLGRIG
jgi:F-type H+-transporting ATPase subunit c